MLFPKDREVSTKNEKYAEHIASFFPCTQMRSRSREPMLPKLKVFPGGQRYFDHILLSVLIIERLKMRMEYDMEGASHIG